jgi:hypothetical protein
MFPDGVTLMQLPGPCSSTPRMVSRAAPARVPALGLTVIKLLLSCTLVVLSTATRCALAHDAGTTPETLWHALSLETGISTHIRITGAIAVPGPRVALEYQKKYRIAWVGGGLYTSPLTWWLTGATPHMTWLMAYGFVGAGKDRVRVGTVVTAGIWEGGIGLTGEVDIHETCKGNRGILGLDLIVFPDEGNTTQFQPSISYNRMFGLPTQ